MINTLYRAAGVLALAAVAAAASLSPAAADTVSAASIKGSARMYFPAPGNDIRITVDAHGEYTANSPAFPTRAWGTFRIYHAVEEPGKPRQVNWGELEVDCLTTGGPTATVTGTLVRATPGGPWEDLVKRKVRMGVSFYVAGKGKGPSRIGLSGATAPGESPLTKCMAPAPDAPVIRGGYVLKDKSPLR
ncbi:hypothetical protein AB0L65_53135 [Nonomuraea sp. NPDC052116]|uniref:hypothetical protein n=1 Tax=Nonomuraea sp. NPDC052116 TaxID=3155665 RepID=UPI00343C5B17